MGLLVDGKWVDQWYDTKSNNGKFVRQESLFRNTVEPGSEHGFTPDSGRYHLYVSLACPWAHRTLIFRKLKGLESHIDVSIVSPDMLENGWQFDDYPGSTRDKLYASEFLHQLYTKSEPGVTTRVTVPILWDTHKQTVVNNESAEIIRIFNSAFNSLTDNHADYYPIELQPQIDEMNDFVYQNVNNGVYRAGFATTQEAYEEAIDNLFTALDKLESVLGGNRYLTGSVITEADWRLFTTLIRFDAVYVGHFKCNIRRIADYPNLQGYLKELYQWPGVAQTVNFDHIKRHYYYSHTSINPTRVVPLGPKMVLSGPHHRERG